MAHRTAASLFKKVMFPTVLGEQKASLPQSYTLYYSIQQAADAAHGRAETTIIWAERSCMESLPTSASYLIGDNIYDRDEFRGYVEGIKPSIQPS